MTTQQRSDGTYIIFETEEEKKTYEDLRHMFGHNSKLPESSHTDAGPFSQLFALEFVKSINSRVRAGIGAQ